MLIYQLDDFSFWTGVVKEINPNEPCPKEYIRSAIPPPERGGKVARWYGGKWVLSQKPDHTPFTKEPSIVITVLQLRRLFTFAEKVTIEEAIANGNPPLKVFMDDLAAATEVDLTDPLVEQGLNILIASEIISEERKQQILANETPDEELP